MHGCVPVLVQAVHAGVSANIYAGFNGRFKLFPAHTHRKIAFVHGDVRVDEVSAPCVPAPCPYLPTLYIKHGKICNKMTSGLPGDSVIVYSDPYITPEAHDL